MYQGFCLHREFWFLCPPPVISAADTLYLFCFPGICTFFVRFVAISSRTQGSKGRSRCATRSDARTTTPPSKMHKIRCVTEACARFPSAARRFARTLRAPTATSPWKTRPHFCAPTPGAPSVSAAVSPTTHKVYGICSTCVIENISSFGDPRSVLHNLRPPKSLCLYNYFCTV